MFNNYTNLIAGNKVVSKREEEKQRQKHEFRLKSMKSMVDSSAPNSLIKKVSNAKKIQLMEGNSYLEKCTEIERENRILYEKMLKIRTKTPNLRLNQVKKSLNHTYRKLRTLEIEQANAGLTERIKRRESAYKVEKFHTDRKETERILNAICEFPLLSDTKRRASVNTISKKTPKRLTPISDNLVHRQGKIMEGKSYLFEIYKNIETYKIMAFDLESPEKLILHLFHSELGDVNDYKKVVDLISIQNGELVLKEPGSDEIA